MGNEIIQVVQGYAIFIDTIAEGRVPLWFDGDGRPYLYETSEEAEREIAEDLIARLEEFLAGVREFEEAMTVEEYIVAVTRLPDGTLLDEAGCCIFRPHP